MTMVLQLGEREGHAPSPQGKRRVWLRRLVEDDSSKGAKARAVEIGIPSEEECCRWPGSLPAAPHTGGRMPPFGGRLGDWESGSVTICARKCQGGRKLKPGARPAGTRNVALLARLPFSRPSSIRRFVSRDR